MPPFFRPDLKIPLDRTSPQWERLVAFYTDYVGFSVAYGNSHRGFRFFTMVRENCLQLVSSPGPFLAGSLRSSFLASHRWHVPPIVLSGVVRQLGEARMAAPLRSFAIPYVLVVMLWPFPIMERFLLPFFSRFFPAGGGTRIEEAACFGNSQF